MEAIDRDLCCRSSARPLERLTAVHPLLHRDDEARDLLPSSLAWPSCSLHLEHLALHLDTGSEMALSRPLLIEVLVRFWISQGNAIQSQRDDATRSVSLFICRRRFCVSAAGFLAAVRHHARPLTRGLSVAKALVASELRPPAPLLEHQTSSTDRGMDILKDADRYPSVFPPPGSQLPFDAFIPVISKSDGTLHVAGYLLGRRHAILQALPAITGGISVTMLVSLLIYLLVRVFPDSCLAARLISVVASVLRPLRRAGRTQEAGPGHSPFPADRP